jgi:ParB family transcriptional regulator, chromosome partitioning protein
VSKDRRLGRGLAALLGTPLEDELHAEAIAEVGGRKSEVGGQSSDNPQSAIRNPQSASAPTPDAFAGLLQLPVNEIEENPFQPRRDFSDVEIASLAESLKEHDMLQPVLVRRVEGRYQLISGERRLRAARHAGWTTIPARVRDADDRLVAELAIVENLQRKDLNAVEKALSFKRYLDEHRCTQDDLARRLKIDRSTIANLMRLLELPGSILDGIRKGTITAGHARALLPLDDEHQQVAFARRIETEGLSVRDVERQVAAQMGEDEPAAEILPGPGKQPRTRSDQVASLEQEIRLALGLKVEIKANSRGRGKLTIHFANHDEFDHLREQLTDGAATPSRRKIG